MSKRIARGAIEIAFIIFLFYSNLLMGEFSRSGAGNTHGLWWALRDIATGSNFAIAIVAGVIGYIVFEFLRRRL